MRNLEQPRRRHSAAIAPDARHRLREDLAGEVFRFVVISDAPQAVRIHPREVPLVEWRKRAQVPLRSVEQRGIVRFNGGWWIEDHAKCVNERSPHLPVKTSEAQKCYIRKLRYVANALLAVASAILNSPLYFLAGHFCPYFQGVNLVATKKQSDVVAKDDQDTEADSQEAMRETSATSPEVFTDPDNARQREVDESIERGDRNAPDTGTNLQS